jgi:beta-N-acetylhexosaminidase
VALINIRGAGRILLILLISILFSGACSKLSGPEDSSAMHIETPEPEDPAIDVLSEMSLSEKIGQLLILQFRYRPDGGDLTALSPEDLELLRSLRPGGVILFRENFDTVEQVTSLIGGLMIESPLPPFIAVDEEGGLVSRLVRSGNIPATRIPAARVIGETGDPAAAYAAYSIIARELAVLGVNMNFAPVADILTDPDNPVILTRAFGSDPAVVADFVAQGVRALQDNGVVSVVKHFPGHGDSSQDSHFDIVRLDHDAARLDAVELVPFRAAIEAGVGGIMTAHLYFPRIDGAALPASLSPYFLGDLLRDELAYDGLIITDALEMRGLEGIADPESAGVAAVGSGADMLLIPPDPTAQRDALLMEVVYGRLPVDVIDRAVRRIISVKITQGIWYNRETPDAAAAYAVLGSDEHRALLENALYAHQ